MHRMAWSITLIVAAAMPVLSHPVEAQEVAASEGTAIRQGAGLGSDGTGHPRLIPPPTRKRLLDVNKDGKINFRDLFRLFGVKSSMDAVTFLVGFNSAQDGFVIHRSNFNPSGKLSLRRNGIMLQKGWRF
jgi:hypothetical protein